MTTSDICPVCHCSISSPIFDGGYQPLATLGWPKTSQDAIDMEAFALDYQQCVRCTHIWNREFSYESIPYSTNPNRMYNKGSIWQGHLRQTAELFLTHLPENPVVIDIGCGEGHFVRGIATQLQNRGHFLGFDPSIAYQKTGKFEFHGSLFEPGKHIEGLQPHGLIMRHVLEHLTDPAVFIEQLAWHSSNLKHDVYFLAEMPCVDNMLNANRLVDFFYEHPSQFTTESFLTLLERAGNIVHFDHGYGGEVVYGIVKLGVSVKYRSTKLKSHAFFERACRSRQRISRQIEKLIAEGKSLAIWGGTGKAAAFMHYFDVTSDKIPVVVDSDEEKVGGFVPKTGQEIRSPTYLLNNPVDILIIPSQWRAKDILLEIEASGIQIDQVLSEYQGHLSPIRMTDT